MKADILIKNSKIITPDIIIDGTLCVKNNKIVYIGTGTDFSSEKVFENQIVIPGFIDAHTHTVFGGDRADEYFGKRNLSYEAKHSLGGGIMETIERTRAASYDELKEKAKRYLLDMLKAGVTTVEIKDGYGQDLPDFETDKKILKIAKELDEELPIDIIATHIAHTVPNGVERKEFIESFIKTLPEFRELAEYFDIFIDPCGFSVEEAEAILKAAKDLRFRIQAHVDQTKYIKAGLLAAKYNAISISHMEMTEEKDFAKMRSSIGILLPGVIHHTGCPVPKYRKMIDSGMTLALASDFNPGSSPYLGMPTILTKAKEIFRDLPAEDLIKMATINAAKALGIDKKAGSLEQGKQADILILDPAYISSPNQIPYWGGINYIRHVIKKGKIIF